jgi:hypothetical protein
MEHTKCVFSGKRGTQCDEQRCWLIIKLQRKFVPVIT